MPDKHSSPLDPDLSGMHSDSTPWRDDYDHFVCIYPDKCIVSGPHFAIECCTAEQAALINADLSARIDAGLAPVSPLPYGLHETTWVEEMAKQIEAMESEEEAKAKTDRENSAG